MSNTSVLSAVALAGLFVSTSLTGTKAKALTSVSASALSIGSAQADDYEARRAASRTAFVESNYSRCDARKYAWFLDSQVDWTEPDSYGTERMTVEEAAIVIGATILNGTPDSRATMDADIASVGFSEGCDLTDSSLWYRDYQAFAAFRGVEIHEAKALIGEQLTAVGNKNFIDAVSPALEARGYIGFGDRRRTTTLLNTYSESAYGYCDAKKVAEIWGIDVDWAKSVIGDKITSDRTELVDADIASTAQSVSCSWAESELSYEDAEALADNWGVSIADAKAQVAQEMSEHGRKHFMETTYAQATYRRTRDLPFGQSLQSEDQDLGPSANDLRYIEAFDANSFGYCDAQKLSTAWDTDYTSAKIRAGRKILDHGNVDAVNAVIQGAFLSRSCTWAESGLDYSDAERLAQFWELSIVEAKNKVAAQMSLVGHRAFVTGFRGLLEDE